MTFNKASDALVFAKSTLSVHFFHKNEEEEAKPGVDTKNTDIKWTGTGYVSGTE